MIERWYVVVVHVALLASIACNHTFDAGGSSSVAPPTKKGMDVDEVAGKAVPDPDRWLEGSDPKTGTSLEISAWQEKQHAYAETYLATLPGRSVLERQLKAMLETKVSVPVMRGQRSFFLARAPGQDRSVLMLEDRTSRGDAGGTKTTRRVLVDPAQWSQRTDAIGPWSVSRDGRFVVYGSR